MGNLHLIKDEGYPSEDGWYLFFYVCLGEIYGDLWRRTYNADSDIESNWWFTDYDLHFFKSPRDLKGYLAWSKVEMPTLAQLKGETA